MSALEDDRPPRAASRRGAWSAIIATDAAGVTSSVMVVIPRYHPQLRWGPCRWMPRGDSVTLPTRGDEAIVMFDDTNTPFIVAWWPF
jgi:hypothetical protein